MATIVRTPSGKWKAVVRLSGWPTKCKTFRLKRDATDWARRTEDQMVRDEFIERQVGTDKYNNAGDSRYVRKSAINRRKLLTLCALCKVGDWKLR